MIASGSRGQWMEVFDAAGIPSGPINQVSEALGSPHAKARDMVIQIEHSVAGSVRTLGLPIEMSNTPTSIRLEPPALGAHTDEVLSELGLTVEEIEQLRDSGIV
jgi:crotonobetainyl-CoA:carnitine CoA-transferase CaiB-like acyl-CoA transferase